MRSLCRLALKRFLCLLFCFLPWGLRAVIVAAIIVIVVVIAIIFVVAGAAQARCQQRHARGLRRCTGTSGIDSDKEKSGSAVCPLNSCCSAATQTLLLLSERQCRQCYRQHVCVEHGSWLPDSKHENPHPSYTVWSTADVILLARHAPRA